MDMLQNQANEILNFLVTSIKEAKDEFPLVAKELLERDLMLAKLHFVTNILYSLVFLVVIIICAKLSYSDQVSVFFCIVGIIASLLLLLICYDNAYDYFVKIISIKTAPKVYLLEKLNIIKKD